MSHAFQPYETDSGSDSEASGVTDEGDETSSSGSDAGSDGNGRLEAMDHWRAQAATWVASAAPQQLVSRAAAEPTTATMTDLPSDLRGRDIQRHVICVDSQFRDAPTLSLASDFYFTMLTPVRNVMRIRITSVEFPNNYPFFTVQRRNVSFGLQYGPGLGLTATVTVAEGNYTAGDMVDALTDALGAYLTGLTVTFSEVTGRFTIVSTTPFAIDTTVGGFDRPFAYGLGYYLGFTRAVHTATGPDGSGNYVLTSNTCANFAGDHYVFIRVNNYECVRQKTAENEFAALAKVILREPKNYMTFDDYGSQHIKEVVFPTPVDLTRLQIQVLDPYGEVLDMCSSQWSMSLEVLELKNRELYNAVRDSLMLRYV